MKIYSTGGCKPALAQTPCPVFGLWPLSISAAIFFALISTDTNLAAAEIFRVATYNLEGYLDAPTETRQKKSQEAKAKIRESIRALNPDVVALQEIGGISALLELRDSLKQEGLDFPYWEHVAGSDTNIHIAVLSRFAFSARHPHTNENYLLS